MACAFATEWLTVEAWALLLSPRQEPGGDLLSDSRFEEILTRDYSAATSQPNGTNHTFYGESLPTLTTDSGRAYWFENGCALTRTMRLELRRPHNGQYGLSEVTLFGYEMSQAACESLRCQHGGVRIHGSMECCPLCRRKGSHRPGL